MAVDAEAHREAVRLVQQRHFVDLAVTFGAPDTLCDVDGVVEVYVIRQVVDAVPDERCIVGKTVTYWRQDRCIRPDLRMARHAGIGRWHARVAGSLDRCVTEATVEPEAVDMVLVTERDRLLHSPVGVKAIVHPWPEPPPGNAKRRKKYQANQRHPDDSIGSRGEDCRHPIAAASPTRDAWRAAAETRQADNSPCLY